MEIEVVKTRTRLQELLRESEGLFYSDTWYTLHRRRCGALKQLKPTESPSYDFAAGEPTRSGLPRGVVAFFHGSFDETAAWLDQNRNYSPHDKWKLCGSCESLVKRDSTV